MRIYKFLNKRWGLAALSLRRLKISRFFELNDPFEVLPFDLTDLVARLTAQLTLIDVHERYGVLCFSKQWSNPVIWSHYADQHRGLCLGFDVPDDLAMEMDYLPEKVPFPIDLEDFSDEDAQRATHTLLYSKFDDWKYEDEVRVTARLDPDTEEDGFFFKNWDGDLRLREVVVGMRSPTCKRQIQRALDGYDDDVAIVQAKASDHSFAVVENLDGVRNHDDATFYLVRDGVMHPVAFNGEGAARNDS